MTSALYPVLPLRTQQQRPSVCHSMPTNPIKIHRRDVNELQPPRKMVGYCRMFCGQVSLGATPGGANDREVWNPEWGREG